MEPAGMLVTEVQATAIELSLPRPWMGVNWQVVFPRHGRGFPVPRTLNVFRRRKFGALGTERGRRGAVLRPPSRRGEWVALSLQLSFRQQEHSALTASRFDGQPAA